jgi:hypothetical protein
LDTGIAKPFLPTDGRRKKIFTKRISAIHLSGFLTDHAKRRALYYADGLTGLRGFAAL